MPGGELRTAATEGGDRASCGEQDEGFAISAKSLAKALADEGLIEPGDNGTNTRTMRFGGRLKRVMLLRKDKANKLVSV